MLRAVTVAFLLLSCQLGLAAVLNVEYDHVKLCNDHEDRHEDKNRYPSECVDINFEPNKCYDLRDSQYKKWDQNIHSLVVPSRYTCDFYLRWDCSGYADLVHEGTHNHRDLHASSFRCRRSSY
ncbi:hypothetical protein CPC08DRAFT_729633 [Agrocybe pediades]|nr:hypothetical protein CPC08DRAFT_729633 [Agrocybe pediades]